MPDLIQGFAYVVVFGFIAFVIYAVFKAGHI